MERIVEKQIESSIKLLGGKNQNGYSKYLSWIIENGRYYKNIENGQHSDHLEIMQKACFRNALLCSLVDNYEYIEGYYITEGIPLILPHAWNYDREKGVAFDLTADKYNIKVEHRFGVKVPKKVLNDYINTEQLGTALGFYHTNIKKYKDE